MNEKLIGDLFVEAQRQMTGSSSREFSQKFAELIVRECDRYARSAWEHGPLLGRDLLIHFGIEEMKDD
jgi:hypothetical protein